jgi:hypothetical protein
MYANKWTINEAKYVLTTSAICAVKTEHSALKCILYNMYAHKYGARAKNRFGQAVR